MVLPHTQHLDFRLTYPVEPARDTDDLIVEISPQRGLLGHRQIRELANRIFRYSTIARNAKKAVRFLGLGPGYVVLLDPVGDQKSACNSDQQRREADAVLHDGFSYRG